jgi:hypothetical protein
MREETLQHLKHIVDALNKNEKTVLVEYLKAFDTRSGGYKPKTLVMLDLLLKNDDLSKVNKYLKKKFGAKSEDAIRMMAYRLKEKIGESLLLDMNIMREGAYDELSQARANIAKKKIIALIYISRGIAQETIDLYDKIIEMAKKFEFYSDLIDTLMLKQQFVGIRQGKKAYDKLNDEIRFYESSRNAAINATNIFYQVTMNFGFKGLNRNIPDPAYVTFLEDKLTILKKDFEETSSALVGYYYYTISIEYNQVLRFGKKASEYCNYLVDIVKNNPSIYLKRRLGAAYLNYSQNELFNYEFKAAHDNALEGKKCFNEGTFNYNMSLELEFYANFYSGKINDAANVMESLIKKGRSDVSEFEMAKRNYLLACTYFAQKQFIKANRTLQFTSSAEKDKEGWNIGIRVFNIMNSIENGFADQADLLVMNLRQFIKEALKLKFVPERDKIILDILIELRKHGYNFEKVFKTKQQQLEQLANAKGNYHWEIQSPELIVFHRWVAAKAREKFYEPVYKAEVVNSLS